MLLYFHELEGLGLLLAFMLVALKLTKSASIGYLPAVVVFGRKLILPMEYDLLVIIDG